MAWLRGKVALGSFPDLAGAVNKISESVKNIEKNFDNALGFEGQQQPTGAGSASTFDASQSSSAPESGGQGNGNGKDSVSKKLEYSKKLESLEKHGESSGKQDDSLKKREDSNKHDQYSSGKHESSDNYEASKLKEGADADDSTKEHFLQNNETSVESLKPEEHQDHNVGKNNAIHEEVDTRAEKPGDTDTVIGDQVVNMVVKSIDTNIATSHETSAITDNHVEAEANLEAKPNANIAEESEFLIAQHKGNSEIGSGENSTSIEEGLENIVGQVRTTAPELNEVQTIPHLQKSEHELNIQEKVVVGVEASYDGREEIESEPYGLQSHKAEVSVSVEESQPLLLKSSDDASEMVPDIVLKDENENVKAHYVNQLAGDDQTEEKGQNSSLGSNLSDKADYAIELETLKKEMKKMEAALFGAARQAQAKADEIAKLVNENEQLKSIIVDQEGKSNEAEIECLREEYHQKISTLEKKVYTLTRERDTLRREQNKRSDAAALLKEKDEIITQVMAEGEALSKKQAIQESTIRKLRAQVREFEDEKKGLKSKLQIEENKVDCLKRDKAVIEKLMQETIEKNQAELATQKEYCMNALSAAEYEKALAKARANDEARTEQESHLREAKERETMLLQTLEELRQTLSRKEQQAFFKEDMLRKDMDDLQKRYQASERRCEELVMQVPESTRPLLRQIETMQEATARKVEAWAAVERSLNIRLQDAEAKAEAAEERYHSVNDRLSKTLSRVNVLEAQIPCLRAEQAQLTKSLEKERQRASENRQEYLALKEETDTNKGHANQLKEEMIELKRKHKRELQEALTQRELLQQDIERERSARLELEKAARLQVSNVRGQNSIAKTKSISENGLTRRLSSANSLSSMQESSFLQASLDSSHTFSERSLKKPAINSYYLKSMTPSAFQSALRQKEGELASYISRLASMESIRDLLSEELVKMTKERDKLRSEVALLPSIKAELEALRVRHSAALELMGERDEELQELRADIVDLKEMYREQVNLLVNKVSKD